MFHKSIIKFFTSHSYAAVYFRDKSLEAVIFNRVVICVQLLRSSLNAEGHTDVLIVAPDAQSWDILKTFAADPEFLNSVDIVG